MKILYGVLFLFLLSSCDSIRKKQTKIANQEKEEKIKSLDKAGESSKEIIDTVLLGYKFGMIKSEVQAHTKKLYKEGRLKLNPLEQLYLPLVVNGTSEYHGFIRFEYFENKLAQVALVFDDAPSPIVCFSEVGDLLSKKYGASDVTIKPIENLNLYEEYWYDKNLKIMLGSGVISPSLHYIDLRKERLINEKEQLEKEKENKKSVESL